MITRRLINHDMTFGAGLSNFASGSEATAQAVKTRLYTLAGEWFLDTSAYVPYTQELMAKPANLPLIEARIKQVILETTGVESINSFTMTLDRDTRRLKIDATITDIDGQQFTIGNES